MGVSLGGVKAQSTRSQPHSHDSCQRKEMHATQLWLKVTSRSHGDEKCAEPNSSGAEEPTERRTAGLSFGLLCQITLKSKRTPSQDKELALVASQSCNQGLLLLAIVARETSGTQKLTCYRLIRLFLSRSQNEPTQCSRGAAALKL